MKAEFGIDASISLKFIFTKFNCDVEICSEYSIQVH